MTMRDGNGNGNGNGNGSGNATVRLNSERMDHGYDDGLLNLDLSFVQIIQHAASMLPSCHDVPDPCVMLLTLFCVFFITRIPNLPVFSGQSVPHLSSICHLAVEIDADNLQSPERMYRGTYS